MASNDEWRSFRLRRLRGRIAETLDAGLAEFARVRVARALRLKAEGGAVVAIARRRRRIGMTRDVQAARRHGEIGPQAKFRAVGIGEDVGARAQASPMQSRNTSAGWMTAGATASCPALVKTDMTTCACASSASNACAVSAAIDRSTLDDRG